MNINKAISNNNLISLSDVIVQVVFCSEPVLEMEILKRMRTS
jgi:hypothetical protein